jgi:hypothetical protein
MCAEQGACVRRRSWAGYTVNMFEFEFPTGTARCPILAGSYVGFSHPLEIDDVVQRAACRGLFRHIGYFKKISR